MKRSKVTVVWKEGGLSIYPDITETVVSDGFLWMKQDCLPIQTYGVNLSLVSIIETEETTVH